MSMDSASPAPVRARRARQEAPASAPVPVAPSVEPAAPVVQAEAPTGPVLSARVRKPFGYRRNKLDNTERAGFHRHWFNDKGSRIKDALDAGYTHVMDAEGKPMKYVVGVSEHGGGMTAYRMEIPLEWYEADQKAKLDERMKVMDQIRRGQAPGGHAVGQDGAYSPTNKSGTTGVDIRNK